MKARYQFRFYPTNQQQQSLARLFGCVRVVWNDALALCKQSEKKPKSAELQKIVITSAKQTEERAWLSEVSAIGLQQSVADLETAFKNFFESCKGKRKGRKVGYPRFKKRTMSQSARLTRGGFSIKGNDVYLAKIGIVRPIWSRQLPSEPSSVTIIKDCANRYFLSFVVEINPKIVEAKNHSIGIDLGIKTFAAMSDGTTAQSPSYKQLDRKIRSLGRKLARQPKDSKRRNKTRIQIAKLHNQIADTRKDFLHKFSTKVVSENQVIVLEDLNVSGMVKNRKLARAISQQGWYEFRVLCEAKSEKLGREFRVISRWEPTSQVCSDCGFKWGKLDLSIRSVLCLNCGTQQDRDLNAAKNIVKVGIGHCHDSKCAQRQVRQLRLHQSVKRKESHGTAGEYVNNPGDRGSYSFNSVVYASPNLDYSTGQSLEQYQIYHTPTDGFVTGRIDISDLANFDVSYPWPFDNTQVPINGQICIPEGDGSFPLAVFAHGNHDAAENSTPGYLYLCELLASHGIIAATIDVNFLNGGNRGENDGRAIVHLEHIKQFQIWNAQAGHPLAGKVDLSRVMIIGHSRGGEAVGHASLFNSMPEVQFDPNTGPIPLDGSQGLGPYGFSLKAVVAIAPTDGQYVPVSGQLTQVRDNYSILHGSRDADVLTFEGYKTYDRSHAIDLANPTQSAQGFKSLLWIHSANHNYFNSVWDQESENTLKRPQQEQIAKVYISAIAQVVLQGKLEYMELLKNHQFGIDAGWLTRDIALVSQYQDPDRRFIQHFEESGDALVVSAPVTGLVNASSINASKRSFFGTPMGALYQETQGLRLEWNATNALYRIQLQPETLESQSYKFLVFRLGQSTERNNPVGRNQDLTIEVGDGVKIVTFNASSIGQILYPAQFITPRFLISRIVMQTFRISLESLQTKGLNIQNITEIGLIFNLSSSGVLYLDDLQLSN